ncbi:MAG: RIP metalloprotease RseP [bacterium]
MMTTIIAFIVVLGILIFVHELGHFLMAKWIGIRVERFSLGFGPKIIGHTYGDTEYRISALPFGGYVKMTGENPEEPLKGEPWEFGSRSIWERTRVVICGPLMNLILAVIFLGLPFFLGRQVPAYLQSKPVIGWIESNTPAEKAGLKIGDLILSINGKEVPDWQTLETLVATRPHTEMAIEVERDGKRLVLNATTEEIASIGMGRLGIDRYIPPMIGGLNPGFPAEKAGLKVGDKILAIDGQTVNHWFQLAKMIHERPEQSVKLDIERDGETFDVVVTPVAFESEDRPSYISRFIIWVKGLFGFSGTQEGNGTIDEAENSVEVIKYGLIGISQYQETVLKKYGVVGSTIAGFKESYRLLTITLEFLYKLVSGKASPKSLGGPIMIAHVAGEAAKTGMGELIYFMGFLSLQLGILNLLPIPVLDGGHLLFFGIEAIHGKPPSIKTREIAQQIGMVILLLLMVYVVYNDIVRYLVR